MIVRTADKQSKETVVMTNDVVASWLLIIEGRCKKHADALHAAIRAADATVICRHIQKIRELDSTLLTVGDAVGQIRDKLKEIRLQVRTCDAFGLLFDV